MKTFKRTSAFLPLVPLTAVAGFMSMLTPASTAAGSFGDDMNFLRQQTKVVVLSDKKDQAMVAVAPDLQGRVLTSTAGGRDGLSYGWINRELIASGKIQPHINVYGGEDRFWLGPEGGQYSIFFAKGVPFDLEHWFTPASFDTEPFTLSSQARDRASFHKELSVTNYSGTIFRVAVDREVRLLTPRQAWNRLGIQPVDKVKLVAFESRNRIKNDGKQAWQKETGLLSIWILGMFNPSPETTIVVPIKDGPETELGPRVNADYFGTVPPDRLIVKSDVIFFKGDGQYRSKIGINPKRARGILGSYDAEHKVLTLVQFTLPKAENGYVNSLWKLQEHPYGGDVANSYNDGPPAPGAKPLGPFYEMESSSPAAALKPGGTMNHVHRTIHLQGTEADLDPITRSLLGVSLKDIEGAFSTQPR